MLLILDRWVCHRFHVTRVLRRLRDRALVSVPGKDANVLRLDVSSPVVVVIKGLVHVSQTVRILQDESCCRIAILAEWLALPAHIVHDPQLMALAGFEVARSPGSGSCDLQWRWLLGSDSLPAVASSRSRHPGLTGRPLLAWISWGSGLSGCSRLSSGPLRSTHSRQARQSRCGIHAGRPWHTVWAVVSLHTRGTGKSAWSWRPIETLFSGLALRAFRPHDSRLPDAASHSFGSLPSLVALRAGVALVSLLSNLADGTWSSGKAGVTLLSWQSSEPAGTTGVNSNCDLTRLAIIIVGADLSELLLHVVKLATQGSDDCSDRHVSRFPSRGRGVVATAVSIVCSCRAQGVVLLERVIRCPSVHARQPSAGRRLSREGAVILVSELLVGLNSGIDLPCQVGKPV
mmetsp:Transcript_16130/g.38665  ORF Transcript_16130/g.38665 Transcript_16130/m.38665 type:complete len:402 (-) Transcript_16130:282-1487(-)